MLEIEFPIRIVSSANLVEHWAKKHKREREQRDVIGLYLRPILDQIKLPIKITLIRIAPRQLDDDNLAYSLKSHRDWICHLIRPGLAPGRADGDRQVLVKYKQNKGNPRQYALKAVFEQLTKDDDDT